MLTNAFVKTTIAVTDLARAKEFYGKRLGLRETESPLEEGDALYELGGGSQLYVYERPDASGSTATACSFEVKEVRAAVDALKEKGVAFEEYDLPDMGLKTEDGVAKMGELEAAWFKDPDGNILALTNSPAAKHRRPERPSRQREVPVSP